MHFCQRPLFRPLAAGFLGSTCLVLGTALITPAQSPLGSQSLGVSPLAAVPSSTTINVEGERVRIQLRRYAPRGVPLQMGVPENSFVTRVQSNESLTRVRFSAGRGGRVTSDDARINIIWFKEAMTFDETETWLLRVAVLAAGGDVPLQPVRGRRSPYPWLRKEWRFVRGTGRNRIVGRAMVGKLKGKYFAVVHQLPIDMVEGYGPRVNAVLKTLQSR